MTDQAMELYVSLDGRDNWSGRLPEPNADESDGPLATIEAARDLISHYKLAGFLEGPVRVNLRGGRYFRSDPIRFKPVDSWPVTYQPYGDETVQIIGGRPVSGWQPDQINGVACWSADVSLLIERFGPFRTLFIDGQRRGLVRFPKQGFFQATDLPGFEPHETGFYGRVSSWFDYNPADLEPLPDLDGAAVVAKHYWTEERLPIRRIDRQKQRLYFTRSSVFTLTSAHGNTMTDYWVENARAATTEPGEWYLDQKEEKLYYIPESGQTPEQTEILVPHCTQLVRFEGRPEDNHHVSHITLKGLNFRETDWVQPHTWGRQFDPYEPTEAWHDEPNYQIPGAVRDPRRDKAAVPQAAFIVPGAIQMRGATHCTIRECSIEGVGFYAINLSDGCASNRIIGNDIRDMGAGGVKVTGGDHLSRRNLQSHHNIISDNEIQDGGKVFLSGCGVALLHSYSNLVVHNHIHDMLFTGVSSGWIWGYSESISRDNLIGWNLIHDLGKGYINDMGAIYLLSVQPGTVVRNNVIHSVESQRYGGWGIYLDEGAAHIIVEHNIVHDTQCAGYNQHWGRENVIRNNIFAFGGEGVISQCAGESHRSFNFERNVVLARRQPIYQAGYDPRFQSQCIHSDSNCFWEVDGKLLDGSIPVAGKVNREDRTEINPLYDVKQWQALGYDRRSIIADPNFADPSSGDFTLADDSPVWQLGFEPIDTDRVGPRPVDKRCFDLPYLRKYYRIYRERDFAD